MLYPLCTGERYETAGANHFVAHQLFVGAEAVALYVAVGGGDVHVDIGVELMAAHVPKQLLAKTNTLLNRITVKRRNLFMSVMFHLWGYCLCQIGFWRLSTNGEPKKKGSNHILLI